MPVSPARKIAYDVLRRVDSARDFAVDVLHRPEVSALKDADRRLATEIVMGVLRWRGELDFHIERLARRELTSFDPEILAILRMGIFQIRLLERVPKFAVVDDAVEITKSTGKPSASGLVNAVLRKCQPAAWRVDSMQWGELSREGLQAIQRAVPDWLFQRWAAREWPGLDATKWRTGAQAALRLAWASTEVPATTLRIVGMNPNREVVADELAQDGVTTRAGELGKFALRVKSGNVLSSRAFREGRVVIQDEASQLVVELVAPEPGQRVLDLCSAPGMKAGLLAQLLERGTLVVCDRSAARLETLRKLLPSQMPAGIKLNPVRIDATRELPFGSSFDRILLDAPCSGTGTLARNPEIKWRLELQDLARFAARQKKMIRNALPTLAPAGRLVYSTCSLEPEENEQVVESVLSVPPGFRRLSFAELTRDGVAPARCVDANGYFRTNPAHDLMDGFFAAVLVRNG
jgi:16S rRNA (cytosine967-C5)-methyltransferase